MSDTLPEDQVFDAMHAAMADASRSLRALQDQVALIGKGVRQRFMEEHKLEAGVRVFYMDENRSNHIPEALFLMEVRYDPRWDCRWDLIGHAINSEGEVEIARHTTVRWSQVVKVMAQKTDEILWEKPNVD